MKIPNIQKFILNRFNLIIDINGNFKDLNTNEILLSEEQKVINLITYNDLLLYEVLAKETGFEKTVCFKKETGRIENRLISNLMLRGHIYNNCVLALKYDDNYNTKIGVYLLDQDRFILLETPQEMTLSNFYLNSFIFISDKNKLMTFDEKGIFIYTKEIKNAQFIGVFNNELWILLPNSEIIALNTQNGELIDRIYLIKKFELNSLAIETIHMDIANAKIKFFAYKYYIEIDLITRKPEIKAYFGKNEKDWFIARSTFYEGDDNLYFIGRKDGALFNPTAGIFNTKTFTIDWYYDLQVEEYLYTFTDPPQANKDYFGVKDNKDNLYLFKRE